MMQSLPDALSPLTAFKQFILWTITDDGKKLPVNHLTAQVADAHDPNAWTDAATAINTANLYGDQYGVGFVFTKNDPFFFIDIDKCLSEDGAAWSPVANDLMTRLQGAAVEISQSGKGLHIFGIGACPEHACKNISLGLELYTEGRFVALTGTNIIGSAGSDCSAALADVVTTYYPPKITARGEEWTTEPLPEYTHIADAALIKKAIKTKSVAAKFGAGVSFKDLWLNNEEVLAGVYIDPDGKRTYDASSADLALAQYLAFWTGCNCERMSSLMKQSALVRDKWEREDYIVRTITRAVSLQEVVYTGGKIQEVDNSIAIQYEAPKLKGSDKQKEWATNLRAQKLIDCLGDEETIKKLCTNYGPSLEGGFWIDHQNDTPEEIIAAISLGDLSSPLGTISGPEIVFGYQFLDISRQIEHFAGCVYIQDEHKVFTPNGVLLKSEQFNATYGGYVFQLDGEASGKTTKKAWEAFTESQGVRYPKAESTIFRPDIEPGSLIEHEGRVLVNNYVPIETPRKEGDVSPFLNHLAKLLPNESDRAIILAFMAAIIQHKGVKFQWAPLIQGAPGNGKTLLTRCLTFAIGQRYTHLPPADQIAEKFNDWAFGKCFIGVEDIYVPEHKREVIQILLPMITNNWLAKRAMQQGQQMEYMCGNFILNSNRKDAIPKTIDDRRFGIFYTAQQSKADIARDGMGGNYYFDLYGWLESDGYAIVAQYLETYSIPDELNPANGWTAPETSSTSEAINVSLGGVEQEILEAIDEGRIGFCKGWISSMALERLLQSIRKAGAIPHNRRRELLQSIGYEWHPALKNGRVNNFVQVDGGKPRLFIKAGHIHANLETAADVVHHYQEAQQGATPVPGSAGARFQQ